MTSFGDPGNNSNRQATVVLNADVSGYSQQMTQAAQQTSLMAQSVDQLQARMSGMHKYFGTKLVHFGAGDFAAIGAATADAATFEKQMSTLASTAAITKTSFSGMSRGIEDTFTSFGTSRAEVIQLTEALTNLGVKGDQNLTQLTRTFIKLGAATGESSLGLATGLTQLSRQMGVTDATQIGNMANVLLTLSKNAGVSASSVLNLSQMISPFAQQLGIGEAKVMAISTAFSKAGQDGGVAANAFSQIAQDIAQLSSTGSRDIAKYSNLLGVKPEQFKGMDKAEAFTQLVEKINKMGPAGAAALDQLGLAGVRTARSFTAMAQSGDLRTQIDSLVGSQGNQNNLNKGADAAFNTLADSLARLRNQFTQIGTEIGSTFLRPLTLITDTAGKAAHAISNLMHGKFMGLPVGKMVGTAMGGLGAASVVGGLALNAAGLIGTVALMRTLRRGAGPSLFNAGRNFEGGRTPNPLRGDARYQNARIAEATSGTMAWYRRPLFNAGVAVDRMFGSGPGSLASKLNAGTWRNMALQAPGRALDAVNRMNARFLLESNHTIDNRDALRAAYPKLGAKGYFGGWINAASGRTATQAIGDQALRTAAGAGQLATAYAKVGVSQLATAARPFWRMTAPMVGAAALGGVAGSMFGVPHMYSLINNARRIAQGGTAKPVGMPANWTNTKALFGDVRTQANNFGMALAANTRAIGSGVTAWGIVGKSAKDLGASALKAAGALRSLSTSTLGSGLAAGSRFGGKLVAGAASGAVAVGKTLGSLALNPYTMMAYTGFSFVKGKLDAKANAGMIHDADLNPIQKYNDALGTTTTNLANFSGALNAAAGATANTTNTTYKQAYTVNGNDVSSATPDKKKNDFWGDLSYSTGRTGIKGKDRAQIYAAGLAALPISSAQQLQAAKEDMLAHGISPGMVRSALKIYEAQGGPDKNSGVQAAGYNWQNLGLAAAGTEQSSGVVVSANPDASENGKHILAHMLSGIGSQEVTDESMYGATYGHQRELQNVTRGLAPMAAQLSDKDTSHYAMISTAKAMATTLTKLTGGGDTGDVSQYLISNHGSAGHTQAEQQAFLVKALGSYKQGQTYLKSITGGGGTIDPAKFDETIATLQNSPESGSFNSILSAQGGLGRFASKDATVQQAMGTQQANTGYVDKAAELLADRATAMSGSLAGAGAALESLKSTVASTDSAFYKQLMAAQAIVMQRQQYAQPFQTRSQNFGDAVTSYHDALKTYNAMPIDKRPSQEEYLKPTREKYEAALAEQQTYLQQMYQTAQQYGVQQTRAENEYELSVSRSKRNFHTQMLNAEQDYNRQVERANEDHNTQLANQAATAAQSIYDPYKKMQTPFAMDAASLAENLGDQNARLARQQAMLNQAHKRGLSTQAIQELNLADPSNYGQLQQIMSGLSPKLIKQINSEVGKRVSNTKSLTQNPFVLAFQQGEDEFHKQLAHGQQDYERSTERAKEQQGVALADMAQDFNTTVQNAGQDLQTAMTEVTGHFGNMYDKTMQQIASSVQKFSPAAAAQMRKDLNSLVQQFPFLLTGDASKYGQNGNYNTKPGTTGINEKGQIGHYDSRGKFHPQTGPFDPASLPLIAPPPKANTNRNAGSRKTHAAEMGAIVKGQTAMLVGEKSRPEMIVPLDVRGRQFLAPFTSQVTRDVLQSLMVSGLGVQGRGSSGGQTVSISEDHSMRFTGDVNVSAADLSDLVRQLKNRKRLSALQSPRRH